MAIKVSQLTAASSVTSADTLYLVQGGLSKKTSLAVPFSFGSNISVGGALSATGNINGSRLFLTNTTDTDVLAQINLGAGDGGVNSRTAIRFRNGGYDAPAGSGGVSVGDKLLLWNAGNLRCGIGLESGGMWFQVSGSGVVGGIKFYGSKNDGLPGPVPTLSLHLATGIANQVNYWVMHGRDTNQRPVLGVNGADTNISIAFVSKGTGQFNFYTGGAWSASGEVTGGAEQFRVQDVPSSVNILGVQGAPTTGIPILFAHSGTDTNVPIGYVTKGSSAHVFYTGTLGTGVTQFAVTHVANSVNWIVAHGRASGNGPVLAANGTDTNIHLYHVSKGTGYQAFFTGGTFDSFGSVSGGQEQFRIQHVASTVNQVEVKGSATGVGVSVAAIGTDTNVGLNLNGKGGGVLSLNPTNGSDIQWGRALIALGGGAAPTFGTIGGSGPATATQNSWMRVLDSTGAAFWVPAWK